MQNKESGNSLKRAVTLNKKDLIGLPVDSVALVQERLLHFKQMVADISKVSEIKSQEIASSLEETKDLSSAEKFAFWTARLGLSEQELEEKQAILTRKFLHVRLVFWGIAIFSAAVSFYSMYYALLLLNLSIFAFAFVIPLGLRVEQITKGS